MIFNGRCRVYRQFVGVMRHHTGRSRRSPAVFFAPPHHVHGWDCEFDNETCRREGTTKDGPTPLYVSLSLCLSHSRQSSPTINYICIACQQQDETRTKNNSVAYCDCVVCRRSALPPRTLFFGSSNSTLKTIQFAFSCEVKQEQGNFYYSRKIRKVQSSSVLYSLAHHYPVVSLVVRFTILCLGVVLFLLTKEVSCRCCWKVGHNIKRNDDNALKTPVFL